MTGTCSNISSFSVSSNRSKYGYPWSEVNASYILKACSADFVSSGTITVTNVDTGAILGTWTVYGLTGTTTTRAEDGTNVRVDIVITDPSTGAVIESRSATTATPKPRAKTT